MDRNDMTILSGSLYDLAVSTELTPETVMDVLEEMAVPRALWQILLSNYKGEKGEEPDHVIRDGLFEHLICRNSYDHIETDKNEKERIRSLVSKWKSGKTKTISKTLAIELCFIFELSLEESDSLLIRIAEEGFHYRDAQEIVYIYALKNKKSYCEAYDLYRRLGIKLQKDQNPEDISEDLFTILLQNDFRNVHTEDDLKKFLLTHKDSFGSFHNFAYSYFSKALNELKGTLTDQKNIEQVWDSDIREPRYFVRTILKERLFSDEIKEARRRSRNKEDSFILTKIEKMITENWPDDSDMSNMIHRKCDVTRKVLILLYMGNLKDPFEISADTDWNPEMDWDESGEADYDYFSDYYTKINILLNSCGFSELDPRSPFDWLIIYILNAGETFDIDLRFRTVFRKMFGQETE